MALSRIRCSRDLPTVLSRYTHPGLFTNTVIMNLTSVPSSRHENFIAFSTDCSASAKEPKKVVSTASATDSSNTSDSAVAAVPLSKAEKFTKAIKDYGNTVFRIGLPLIIRIITCYVTESSGVDLGASDKMISENAMANSSMFLITVLKLFAPIGISMTLSLTPVLVKYLRRIGILKTPKK